MALKKTHAAALCAVFLAGGCSFAEEALFPTTDGSGSQAYTAPVQPAQTTDISPAPASSYSSSTGTHVGQKVVMLRNDLGQLQNMLSHHSQQLQAVRNDTVADSQRYHGTVAAINARLQVGTTPGNPILTQQWNGAQAELDRINEDVLRMNRLANEVTSSSALAGYLLESVKAARQLSGAVDEDHRQLRILEDETNRTVVLVERLLTELANDVSRQQAYVASERQNLNTMALAIKNGQLYGQSLTSRGLEAAPMGAGTFSGSASTSGTPLVTIRFDRPNVNYESALYSAVRSALERKPSSTFDVVAITPAGTTPGAQALASSNSRRNMESVMRSLTTMGLPASRIRSSQTTSSQAQTGEVQVFVR